MTGRAAPMSSTTLELDHASAVPLHRQIYERLCRVVLDRQLKMGERIPSVPHCANQVISVQLYRDNYRKERYRS